MGRAVAPHCASGAQHEVPEKAFPWDNIFCLHFVVVFSSFVITLRPIVVENNPHVVVRERKRY